MRQLLSVFRFEFSSYAKNKTFVGMTIILMVIAMVGPAVPAILNTFSSVTGERTIAVVDNSGLFTADMLEAFVPPRAVFFADMDQARQAVNDGTHNYALELEAESFTLYVTAMGFGVGNLQAQISSMLRDQYRASNLLALGVETEQMQAIFNFSPHMEVFNIAAEEEIDDDATSAFFESFIYAYVMTFVLYMGLLIGGAHLLVTVVREKSTKTMELLVTSCPSTTMLNGKVLGVGAAVLSQLLLMVGAAVASMNIVPLFTEGLDLFTVSLQPTMLVYLVVFFILGFVMYSYIYAALAATTSRMEDATSMGQIPQMIIIGAFIASVFASQNPGAAWVQPLSHVPLLAPFLMFVRISMGMAQAWEIAVSIVVQVATIGLISWMAAKIYRMGTLMYGAKPTLKNLLQAFKK